MAVRNIRRDCMHDLRELKDAGDVGSDDEHRAEVELQKLTDAKVSELDALMKGKEAEDPRGLSAMEGASESDRARYVAIITDGNGRWAERRGLSASRRATRPARTT